MASCALCCSIVGVIMSSDRREFLQQAAIITAGLGMGALPTAAQQRPVAMQASTTTEGSNMANDVDPISCQADIGSFRQCFNIPPVSQLSLAMKIANESRSGTLVPFKRRVLAGSSRSSPRPTGP